MSEKKKKSNKFAANSGAVRDVSPAQTGTAGNTASDIGIIGAGFSGMIAAILIKRGCPSLGVTLYEGKSVPGKKIPVTGNGRCNLTNRDVSFRFYNGDEALFDSVYRKDGNLDLLSFFTSLGVYCREDASGRFYPVSNQAVSVLGALKSEISRLGIEIITDCKVEAFERKNNGYIINGRYFCTKLVFACGGCAAPVHGSDGSGLEMLKKAGVEITPLYPSLTCLYIDSFGKSLKGVRAQGKITLKSAGKILACDEGEIQYTDYGLSGIPAFQVSSSAVRVFAAGMKVTATVDSAPFFTQEELEQYIRDMTARYGGQPASGILSGIMPPKLGCYYLSSCSLNPEKSARCVSDAAAKKLAGMIKSKKYEITGTGPFSDAQVTSGGIAGTELEKGTLRIKKLPGAYACGEITDIDGLCGGYNLQWAFSSAAAVARGILSEATDAENK